MLMSLLKPLFRLPRKRKRAIQLLADVMLIAVSFLLAMMLRLDSWAPIAEPRTWLVLLFMVPASLVIFIRLGFYRAIIRYMNQKAIRAICAGVAASALSLAVTSYLLNLPVPRSVPFIYAMLALITIGGVRFGLRALYLNSQLRHKTRVLVYGAGAAGRQLVASLRQGQEYWPVAFVDDARGLRSIYIEGIKVYNPDVIERLVEEYGVQKVLLAMPSTSRARRRDLLKRLEPLSVPVQTIPGIADVVSGKAKINEIRDVSVEDLLGRDPVPPAEALLDANIKGKVVMVTGAGGSIGSELCRQIIMRQPETLLLFDVAEYSLYSIEQELLQLTQRYASAVKVKALLGSVQHRQRNEAILTAFGVQTIYHAAAYKHVPMVEHNVVEGLRNNVFGTLEMARAAASCGVESFVLVSTDKAVRPTNVMGASKRLAELVCQAMASRGSSTCFSMVRFGNVLGSSGSVVPLFRRQIEQGGPVTVTHPEITRYFMTIPEAAQLVIQAGAMAKGGDVFVLDMGEPVKIAELAGHMVRLSGLDPVVPPITTAPGSAKGTANDAPEGDIEIVFTGLRPGEKLYEELLIGEEVAETRHPRIMTANETYWEWPQLDMLLGELFAACNQQRHDEIRRLLLEAPAAYDPQGEIADLVWDERCRQLSDGAGEPEHNTPLETASVAYINR
ncbi:nucleoside-diphosphate sugar epimerase [Halomonas sp. 1513]|nr:nucleoside-diphosphate sugar epimerase/dehydratase [Halomonas sp. 1513]APX93248.1 nucleoside-diphosphate sugar epimerase [Halomonas sp. 1513]